MYLEVKFYFASIDHSVVHSTVPPLQPNGLITGYQLFRRNVFPCPTRWRAPQIHQPYFSFIHSFIHSFTFCDTMRRWNLPVRISFHVWNFSGSLFNKTWWTLYLLFFNNALVYWFGFSVLLLLCYVPTSSVCCQNSSVVASVTILKIW